MANGDFNSYTKDNVLVYTRRDQTYTSYYENGKVKSIDGHTGEPLGKGTNVSKEYDESGNLIKTKNTTCSSIQSFNMEEYDKNGELISKCVTNSKGEITEYYQVDKKYDESGKLISTTIKKGSGKSCSMETYENGVLTRKFVNENGKVVENYTKNEKM